MLDPQGFPSFSPYPVFSFLNQQPFALPVERLTTRVLYRRAYSVLPEEILILRYLAYFGKQVSGNDLGIALGFALTDDFSQTPPRYRDEAEAGVWVELLARLEQFGLLRQREGMVYSTPYTATALDTKTKYQYFTGDCHLWEFMGLSVPNDFPFHDFGKTADLDQEQPAQHPGRKALPADSEQDGHSEASMIPPLLAKARNQIIGSAKSDRVEILALAPDDRTRSYPHTENIPAIGHCYRYSDDPADQDATDYRITAAVQEVASYALTAALNEPANISLRLTWGHACEFAHFWADPDAIIDKAALQRFSTDWHLAKLFADNRLAWSEPGVLEELKRHAQGVHREHLSEHIPLPLLEAVLDTYPSLWSWSQLSRRLGNDFISSHLTQRLDHAQELRYPWDFEVLSHRSPSAIEDWLNLLLHSDWAEDLTNVETFDWDWAALTLSLSEPFVLANMARMPFSRSILPERGPAFVVAALRAEMAEDKVGSWQWDRLHDELDIQFVWDYLPQLQHHVKWKRVLEQLLRPAAVLPDGFDLARLLQLVGANQENMYPFATEKLAWTPELIDFFDSNELLQWSSNSYSPGFEVHPGVAWTENHFVRYHARVENARGRAYVSAQITDLALVERYPDFGWDWQELSGNPHFTWTRTLTSTYRDQIVWSRLLQRFGPEEVAQRLPSLHAQLEASKPDSLADLWRYANERLAASTLLAWHAGYAGFLDLGQLCRRDAQAVGAALLSTHDFDAAWDWEALATRLPPEMLSSLLRELELWYRKTADERVTVFSLLAAPRLPLSFSIASAPILTLPWDWDYVSRQLTPDQLHENLAGLAAKVDWAYLVHQKLMHPLLTASWVLDPRAQPYLPWNEVSRLLSPAQVEAHLAQLASLLDWEYLARQPGMRSMVVDQLLDHSVAKERLPWEFVLGNYFTPTALANNIQDWTQRFNTIQSAELRSTAWRILTRLLPVEAIFPNTSESSYHVVSLSELRTMQLDWEFLSADPRLAHRLTLDVLRRYQRFWHWPTLSRNSLLNAAPNYLLDAELNPQWDWEWISEFSSFIRPAKKLATVKDNIRKYAKSIHWGAFSRRSDLSFTGKLLQFYANKPLEWESISKSGKLSIDGEQLLILQDKAWDWALLSVNPGLSLNLPALIQLADHPWDWAGLSANPSLNLSDHSVLVQLADRTWDWHTLTRRPDLGWTAKLLQELASYDLDWQFVCSKMPMDWTMELLDNLRDYLDWQVLSHKPPFVLTPELLRAFKAYWNFDSLSHSTVLAEPHAPKPGHDAVPRTMLLAQTTELPWNWKHVSARLDVRFSEHVLDLLVSHLHWPSLSRRQWGTHFGVGWVARYRSHWDLIALAKYAQLPAQAQAEVLAAIESDPTRILPYLYSLKRHDSSWAGYAFHCTHLTNAAAIIKSNQLLSRNEVLKTSHKLADASGSINFYPSKIWDYARLYYRPQTFTQFYTEQLGIDISSFFDKKRRDVYHRAENLGFPKCPIPVYFRFRLDEILKEYPERFFISDGNMQKGDTIHGPLRTMLRRFRPDRLLYYRKGKDPYLEKHDWDRHKDISQQEILVESGLSFVGLETIDIFVQDDWAYQELRRLIGCGHPLADRIQIDHHGHCFHNENKVVSCSYSDTELSVKTTFADDHDLIFECDDMSKIAEVHLEAGTYRKKGNQLISQGKLHLSLHEPVAFRVSFHDKVKGRPGGPREYALFGNAPKTNAVHYENQ